MMYSEFIDMSGKSESYISFSEYSTLIEPIYMECELSKKEFIAVMKEAFEKLVYPVVEKFIHNLPIEDKLLLIHDYNFDVSERIAKVDLEARKLAYQYMKLMLTL